MRETKRKSVPARAREKPGEERRLTETQGGGAKSTTAKSAAPKRTATKSAVAKPTARKKTAHGASTESLERESAQTIARRLPEIADSMAKAAVEGNTTAARVCLDILARQPKAEDDGVVYVLTHVEGEDGKANGEADRDPV